MNASNDMSERDLHEIKSRLKAGRLEPGDIKVLESLVERTERAAKQLRAAIVE
jgi:hypothetical protein